MKVGDLVSVFSWHWNEERIGVLMSLPGNFETRGLKLKQPELYCQVFLDKERVVPYYDVEKLEA